MKYINTLPRSEHIANLDMHDSLKYVRPGSPASALVIKRIRSQRRIAALREIGTLLCLLAVSCAGLWVTWNLGMPITSLPIVAQGVITFAALSFFALFVYALVSFAFIKYD